MPLNLLPWREQRDRRLILLCYTITFALLLLITISLGIIKSSRQQSTARYTQENSHLQQLIHNQEQAISQSPTCLHQARLLSQTTALPRCLVHNTQYYQGISAIADALPVAVRLTELQLNDRSVTVTGVAKSSQALSAYVHNLTLCKQLKHAHLAQISQQKTDIDFSLTATLSDPA